MVDLFDSPQTNMVLNPSQSLALRRLIDVMKADDTIYSACPEAVRRLIADIVMPAYSTAEQQIADLQKWGEDNLKLADRFGARIQDLEAQLDRRSRAA